MYSKNRWLHYVKLIARVFVLPSMSGRVDCPVVKKHWRFGHCFYSQLRVRNQYHRMCPCLSDPQTPPSIPLLPQLPRSRSGARSRNPIFSSLFFLAARSQQGRKPRTCKSTFIACRSNRYWRHNEASSAVFGPHSCGCRPRVLLCLTISHYCSSEYRDLQRTVRLVEIKEAEPAVHQELVYGKHLQRSD